MTKPEQAVSLFFNGFGLTKDEANCVGQKFLKKNPSLSAYESVMAAENWIRQNALYVVTDDTLSPPEKTARFQLMCLTYRQAAEYILRLKDADQSLRDFYKTISFNGVPSEQHTSMVPQKIVSIHPFRELFSFFKKLKKKKSHDII